MIVFIVGTSAELIKIEPVIRRLIPEQQCSIFWTAQQGKFRPNIALASPPISSLLTARVSRPLTKKRQVPYWIIVSSVWLYVRLRQLRRTTRSRPTVVVHGDTLTCLVGAFVAKISGLTVAHVEAGLRSGRWNHPFPEELIRRLVSRIAIIHFAPGRVAVENLSKVRSEVVDTHCNTIVDSMRDVLVNVEVDVEEPQLIVLLHRAELLRQSSLVRETYELIFSFSKNRKIKTIVILDDFAEASIGKMVRDLAKRGGDIRISPKLQHIEFIRLLVGATAVVTDSGGLQEETALLGIPCLVHRCATERNDGLGTTSVLSGWDLSIAKRFLEDYAHRPRNGFPLNVGVCSPSRVIVSHLLGRATKPTV